MRTIQLPMDEETIRSLHAGETVALNGIVYTARDAAHKRMHDLIAQKKELPFEIRNAAIYYVGPTPAKKGQVIGSAGPTTASRMDAWTPELLDLGLQAMIGKGRRNDAVKEAIVRNHAIYFVACGGAGALLAHHIVSNTLIAFPELLSEAVRRLEVKDFPVFVGIDSYGKDIYDKQED